MTSSNPCLIYRPLLACMGVVPRLDAWVRRVPILTRRWLRTFTLSGPSFFSALREDIRKQLFRGASIIFSLFSAELPRRI